ncbi:MAG: GIY-YIG nuclease family protein [Candidatus Helarchaeota archaeon]
MRGVYLLIIEKSKSSNIKVGSLGLISFPPGIYIYVGSAMGISSSTNIENRLKRHLRKEKNIHWHIDYLLNDNSTSIVDAIYAQSETNLECELFQSLRSQSKSFIINCKNFGASDCVKNCTSHLLYVNDLELNEIYQHVENAFKSLNLKHEKFIHPS